MAKKETCNRNGMVSSGTVKASTLTPHALYEGIKKALPTGTADEVICAVMVDILKSMPVTPDNEEKHERLMTFLRQKAGGVTVIRADAPEEADALFERMQLGGPLH